MTFDIANKSESGGLSGPPLKPLTLRALSTLRANLPSSIPLIGCGGISSGADALEYAKAGASAVQIYTWFGYDGVGACSRIKDELRRELEKEGKTWAEVVRGALESRSEKIEKAVTRRGLMGRAKAVVGNVETTAQESVTALIKSAEEISRQLDDLAEKFSIPITS